MLDPNIHNIITHPMAPALICSSNSSATPLDLEVFPFPKGIKQQLWYSTYLFISVKIKHINKNLLLLTCKSKVEGKAVCALNHSSRNKLLSRTY